MPSRPGRPKKRPKHAANAGNRHAFYSGAGTRQYMVNALPVARKGIAALAPLPFLAGQQRHRWYKSLPVSLVLVMSARPSMPPGELLHAGEVQQQGGKEDYCWIICEHGHVGRPQIDWIMPTADALEASRPGRRPSAVQSAAGTSVSNPSLPGPSPIEEMRKRVDEVFA